MHIFLTGEKQVGKSTVIAKTLSLLKIRIIKISIKTGGFKTYFGPDRVAPDKLLYLNSFAEPKVFRAENAVARFSEGQPPQVLTQKFDTYGVELIRSARSGSDLILMDECGYLERDALFFHKEIIDALNGNTPVLGVVKLAGAERTWTDRIRNHPKVQLSTVTKRNRELLPQILAGQLAQIFTDTRHLLK